MNQFKLITSYIFGLSYWSLVFYCLGWMTSQAAQIDISECKVQPMPYQALVDALHDPRISQTGWADAESGADNDPVQMFKSDRGTMTIIKVLAPGMACIIAAYHNLGPMRPEFPTAPKDAVAP